ncbi:MAG: YfiR family protein [Alphaproteobacteria bacterium]|nr:YfiR family protein [Alphaproteobacteria bacterium]
MGARSDIAGRPIKDAISVAPILKRLVFVTLAVLVIILSSISTARADSVIPVAVAPSTDEAARERVSREYLIKAAILYNLAKFATWPETAFTGADAPVRLCVLGRDPFGAALQSLRGKRVGQRQLAITMSTDVDNAPACHILFVSGSEEPHLGEILDTVSRLPILTVADFEHFATAGGIIGLTEVEDRSRLEVNVDAAGLAGVRLSSKLLRLAVTVDTQTAQINAVPEK